MCNCVNVPMGSYENQEEVELPWSGKKVGIDRCILPEIKELWEKGVKTGESCCGHNKVTGYILVEEESIILMRALGYNNDPAMWHRQEIFIPKSLPIIQNEEIKNIADVEKLWIEMQEANDTFLIYRLFGHMKGNVVSGTEEEQKVALQFFNLLKGFLYKKL